ncbi:hypothetical protein BDD12DRAFT_547128 [Trichophaea hybrida]|nr:hypothetical protein BDD12DRAFT_547128 [Trichophaea hybrida]
MIGEEGNLVIVTLSVIIYTLHSAACDHGRGGWIWRIVPTDLGDKLYLCSIGWGCVFAFFHMIASQPPNYKKEGVCASASSASREVFLPSVAQSIQLAHPIDPDSPSFILVDSC